MSGLSPLPGVPVRLAPTGAASRCAPILRALPGWFGIESAVAAYLQAIDTLPTYLAGPADALVGFLTVRQHNPFSAEIEVMGVLPAWHRRGVGRALLQAAERDLRATGVEYLQVKTLAPSHPDLGYARTRAFYRAVGFRPLQELPQIWDAANPCLILIKALAPA